MEKSLSELWEGMRQGQLDRRDFVRQVSLLAGGAAVGLVAGLPTEANAGQLVPTIIIEEGTYKSLGEDIPYYLARPRKGAPFPAMLVIHEIFGLSEFIKDVVRLFAHAGYLAMAPSLLPGRAALPDGKHSQWMLDTLDNGFARVGPPEIQKLLDGYTFLTVRPDVAADYVGSVGFCWGGARSFTLATVNPDLWAAIVFYGSSPPSDAMAAIEAPVLGLYGALDNNNANSITGRAAETARTMRSLNKTFEWEVYHQAPHGFFRNGNVVASTRAAGLAWSLLHDFLARQF